MSRDRLAGGLFGLLIGDALGVPYEFHPPDALPSRAEIEMQPPPDFERAHRGIAPGTWSDDGAQALCLLASLLENGRLDVDDFATRLLAWFERGSMAVDGRVFDVGIQTQIAFRALAAGTPAVEAGPREERSNGNGSLMRVLPLALWHKGSDAELARDAMLQSVVTHGHARSRVACAVYCLWARRVAAAADRPWHEATTAMRALLAPGSEEEDALESHVRPDDPPEGRGSGYVIDTLRSARLVVARGDYEAVVKEAVALGDDTDTTACVAGGIAGLRDGYERIPSRFRHALRGRDLADPLFERLCAHWGV